MPRPIFKELILTNLLKLPGELFNRLDNTLTNSNPLLIEIVEIINNKQKMADAYIPYLPSNNEAIANSDWDNLAASRWGVVPTGGVISVFQTINQASNELSTGYSQRLIPLVTPRLFVIEESTGTISDPRRVALTTPEVDQIRPELVALKDALEPISETK